MFLHLVLFFLSQVVVVDTPPDFLLPGYFRSGSGTQMIATSERHHLKFLAPPKPRVRVRVVR